MKMAECFVYELENMWWEKNEKTNVSLYEKYFYAQFSFSNYSRWITFSVESWWICGSLIISLTDVERYSNKKRNSFLKKYLYLRA